MADQNTNVAKISAINQKTGEKLVGVNQIRQAENKGILAYTNEGAIETRIVDQKEESKKRVADELSQSEDEGQNSKSEQTPPSMQVNKLKPKKFVITDEEGEGYIASNSDNNFEGHKNRSRALLSKVSQASKKEPEPNAKTQLEGAHS